MAPTDPARTAERVAAVDRHLSRVAAMLPERAEDLQPATDASDAVVLPLWQAVQVVVDLAPSWAVRAGLSSPSTYADAFRAVGRAGLLDADLSRRLAGAAGFRNLFVHDSAGPGPGPGARDRAVWPRRPARLLDALLAAEAQASS